MSAYRFRPLAVTVVHLVANWFERSKSMSQGGVFVDKRGALMQEVAAPGSLVPLNEALSAALRAAQDAGADSGSVTLPLAFAPSGKVGGPVLPFAVAGEASGLHQLTLHFSRGEQAAAEVPTVERASQPNPHDLSHSYMGHGGCSGQDYDVRVGISSSTDND